MTELKAQVNRLEAEVEEQRAHKQVAMVENEQLRMEVEGLLSASVAGVGAQIGLKEADSECKEFCPGGLSVSPSSRGFSSAARAQAAELRFSQLKERHAELITSHADLMKKVNSYFVVCEENAKKFLTVNFESVQNADTVKLLSATKQEQDDLLRAKRQVENQLETLRQEKRNMVRYRQEQETPSVSVHDVTLAVRLLSHQVNQQQQEAQQLNQDLLQQKAEVTALRSSLENKEKVRLIHTSSPPGVLLVIAP